jgi:hypothetical protein
LEFSVTRAGRVVETTMKYLFCFGYETPEQYEYNRLHGWDDEDSHAVWIEAGSEDAAMSIGYRYAFAFIEKLYTSRGSNLPFKWKTDTYACWIEDEPEKHWTPRSLEHLDTIQS